MTTEPKITIDAATCSGCGVCYEHCPTDVFRFDDVAHLPIVAYPADCCTCFICEDECPTRSIRVRDEVSMRRRRSVYDDPLVKAALEQEL
jgi:NAD-dependent dihydropyrimidine dehydrogenase PreA subunit